MLEKPTLRRQVPKAIWKKLWANDIFCMSYDRRPTWYDVLTYLKRADEITYEYSHTDLTTGTMHQITLSGKVMVIRDLKKRERPYFMKIAGEAATMSFTETLGKALNRYLTQRNKRR